MCTFCDIVTGRAEAHLVYSDDDCVAFLDRLPLFHGHSLLVPRRHVETLPELSVDELLPFFTAVQLLAREIPEAMDAHGSLLLINNKVSQSVPHLHAHIVPRRFKDGLRGFLWPRSRYQSAEQMASVADKIRNHIAGLV